MKLLKRLAAAFTLLSAAPTLAQDIVFDEVTFGLSEPSYMMGHFLGGDTIPQFLIEISETEEPAFALLNCYPGESVCIGGLVGHSATPSEITYTMRLVFSPSYKRPEYAILSHHMTDDQQQVRHLPDRILQVIYWEVRERRAKAFLRN